MKPHDIKTLLDLEKIAPDYPEQLDRFKNLDILDFYFDLYHQSLILNPSNLYVALQFVSKQITKLIWDFYKGVEENNVEEVERILKKGISPNIRRDQNESKPPILSFAISFGSYAVVNLLLENGSNIDVTDSYGLSPIGYVIYKQNSQETKDLFNKMMQLNPDLTIFNVQGQNIFQISVETGKFDWFEPFVYQMPGEVKKLYHENRLLNLFAKN